MGGFLNALSFLAPVGETLGGAANQLNYQAQQQRAQTDLLKSLGPEYQPLIDYAQAGGHNVLELLGGNVGKDIQQKFASQRMAEIMQQPGDRLTNLWQAAGEGLISSDDVMNYGIKDEELKIEERKAAMAGGVFKPTGDEANFLSRKGITGEEWQMMGEDARQAVFRGAPDGFSYNDFLGEKAGYEMKPVSHPETGETTYQYMPKRPGAGVPIETGAQVTPRQGGNPQQMLYTSRQAMQDLTKILQDTGRSGDSTPMWQDAVKRWIGVPIDQTDNEIINQQSLLETNLTGMVARAWGTRNIKMAKDMTTYHIPKAGESPAATEQKMQDWLRSGGFFDKYLQAVGGKVDPATMTADISPTPAGGGTAMKAGPSGPVAYRSPDGKSGTAVWVP